MKLKHLIEIFFSIVISCVANATWNINDVSYLFPLPSDLKQSPIMSLKTEGRGGPLLSYEQINRLPLLHKAWTRQEMANKLKVLAVRIDPCFPLPTPMSCQQQIRMVWQPLVKDANNRVTSLDIALHSFYVLSGDEFFNLLKDLKDWKMRYAIDTDRLPLQVHPSWSIEGDKSPSLLDFQNIMTKYAGAENLSRVTILSRASKNSKVFAGFEVTKGQLRLLRIPRINRHQVQTYRFGQELDIEFGNSGIFPEPKSIDTINNIVSGELNSDQKTEDVIKNEIRSALKIENPHFYNPENMDCVSCHLAQPVRQWGLNKKPDIYSEAVVNSEFYSNKNHNLSNLSQDLWNINNLRSFGYFNNKMSLSQRVINESAEVADYLNKLKIEI
jgi:hypothetical protein